MITAVGLALLTIFFLVCLLFMKSTRVFHICGWMQIISGVQSPVPVAVPDSWHWRKSVYNYRSSTSLYFGHVSSCNLLAKFHAISFFLWIVTFFTSINICHVIFFNLTLFLSWQPSVWWWPVPRFHLAGTLMTFARSVDRKRIDSSWDSAAFAGHIRLPSLAVWMASSSPHWPSYWQRGTCVCSRTQYTRILCTKVSLRGCVHRIFA